MGSWSAYGSGSPYGDDWSGYYADLKDGDTANGVWEWGDGIDTPSTSDYLYIPFSDDAICTKFRYFIDAGSDAPTSVSVQVTYNGVDYEDCFGETSVVNAWNECILPKAGIIQGIRIRGYKGGGDWHFELSEIDLWKVTPAMVSLDGCVGFYKMNEQSGIVANDVSGNDNHGAIMENLNTRDASFLYTELYTPLFLGMFIFNDTDDEWIDIDAVAADLGVGDKTFLVWFKESATAAHLSILLGINSAAYGNVLLFGLKPSTGILQIHDGSWHECYDDIFENSTWHCAGFTFKESTGAIQLLADAVNCADEFVMASSFHASSDHYSIGMEFDAGENPSDHWDGSMCHAMCFNRVLTEDELVTIYYNGNGIYEMNQAIVQRHHRIMQG